jgi:hypothetical protein
MSSINLHLLVSLDTFESKCRSLIVCSFKESLIESLKSFYNKHTQHGQMNCIKPEQK